MENAKKIFPQVIYCDSALTAVEGVDFIIIATEWDEFKHLDLTMCAQRCGGKKSC
jgi:UDPglucose 6-dehydrogenase